MEMDYLQAPGLEPPKVNFPSVKFVPAQDLFSRATIIKTPREIDALHILPRILDQSIAERFYLIAAGSSEMDIASSLTHEICARGARDFKFMVIVTGERSK